MLYPNESPVQVLYRVCTGMWTPPSSIQAIYFRFVACRSRRRQSWLFPADFGPILGCFGLFKTKSWLSPADASSHRRHSPGSSPQQPVQVQLQIQVCYRHSTGTIQLLYIQEGFSKSQSQLFVAGTATAYQGISQILYRFYQSFVLRGGIFPIPLLNTGNPIKVLNLHVKIQ